MRWEAPRLLNFIRAEGSSLDLHFMFVYTREAHASDTWPMKWAVEWPEPRNIDARITCAKKCDADLGWSPDVEVLVDGMTNEFCSSFGAWPANGYVLSPQGQLLFVCDPPKGSIFFDVERLFQFLRDV